MDNGLGSEYPKIIAQQGDEAYLIQLSAETAQVVDWGDFSKERFAEFNLQSILARGYWEDLTAPHPSLEELLAIKENPPIPTGIE
jgi:hypothetical protein